MKLKPFEVDQVLAELYGQFKDELTAWESSFVGSIQLQWRRSGHLSDRQDRKLQDIWGEFASGRRRRTLGADPYNGVLDLYRQERVDD